MPKAKASQIQQIAQFFEVEEGVVEVAFDLETNFIDLRSSSNSIEARKTHDMTYPGTAFRRESEKLWDKKSTFEVRMAETWEERKEAYENSRPGSDPEKMAFDRWDEYCRTEIRQAKNLDEAKSAVDGKCPVGGQAEIEGLARIDAFSIAEIKSAKNLEELAIAKSRCIPGSRAERFAFEKALEFFPG